MTQYYDPAKGISRYVSDPSALRAVNDWQDREIISLQHTRPQRAYIFDAASLRSDDGTNVIKPRILTSSDPGRWILVQATSSGGVTFLSLTDTPGSYAGQGGRTVRVNPGETGLEFSAVGGGCNECLFSDPTPANWLDLREPETVEQALQSAFEFMYNHLGFPLTPVAPVGTGCTFADDPAHWVAGAFPTSVIDALQSLSLNIYNHLGFTITTNGLNQGCAPYSDNPVHWSSGVVAPTILEAIQSMIDAMVLHWGAPIRVLPGECMVDCDYIDSSSTWANFTPPESTLAALQSLARELALHKGSTIDAIATAKGCPYKGGPDFWTGGILPATLLGAAQSIAKALYDHIGAVIPNSGFSAGCAIFQGDPNYWGTGEPPLTLMEAVQCMAAKLSAHLSRPLVSLGHNLFINLGDTPLEYAGQAGMGVQVNSTETALEFTTLDWTNAGFEFVIGSADKTPPDTLRDVSDPSFLHQNGVNDAFANAIPVINSVGGGVLRIRSGNYQTDQKFDITADLLMKGSGFNQTRIAQTDQNPTTANWLFNFTGDGCGLEDLSIYAPVLTTGSPEYLVRLGGSVSRVSNLVIFSDALSTVTKAYLFVENDINTWINRYLAVCSGGDSLMLSNTTRFTIENCLLYAMAGDFCLVLDNVSDGTITENEFYEINQFSQSVKIVHTGSVTRDLRIFGNYIQGGARVEGSGGSQLEKLIFTNNNVEMYQFEGFVAHGSGGGSLRHSQINGNTFKRIFIPATPAIQAIKGFGGAYNSYDNNTIELGDKEQAVGIELSAEANASADHNTIDGDGENQCGVRFITCGGCHADDNTIELTGLSSAAYNLDGGIKIYYCNHTYANNNEIQITASYAKGISIEGNSANKFLGAVGNDIYMGASTVALVGDVRGIEVITGTGAPTKVKLNSNGVDAIHTGVVGIYAKDNNIKGVCVGNTIQSGLSTPLDLGSGIMASTNDTT